MGDSYCHRLFKGLIDDQQVKDWCFFPPTCIECIIPLTNFSSTALIDTLTWWGPDDLILIIHHLSTFYPSIRIIRTQSDNWWKIFYCCISILLVLKMMKYWLSIQRKRKLYSHHEQSKAFEIPVSLSEHKLCPDQNMLLSPRDVPTYKKLQSLKQI